MARTRIPIAKPRIPVTDTRRVKPASQRTRYYQTQAHRDWADAVIARAGGKCQGARHEGPNPPNGRLYADHIIELKDGGAALDPANGQALCGACHQAKGAAERLKRMTA